MNEYFFNLTGVNLVWYEITDWLGISAIVVCMLFTITGLVQLVKRKSLFKVDSEIVSLGVLYIIVFGVYLFFEIVPVKYRPIIIPGCTAPEPSFPSTHTMIVCVIMGSALMVLDKYIQNDNLRKTLLVILTAIIIVNRQIDFRSSLVDRHYRGSADKCIIIDVLLPYCEIVKGKVLN